MNQREQWFCYWAQQLGYLTDGQLQAIKQSDEPLEAYVADHRWLSDLQMSNLRFLFIDQCLLQAAKQAGYVNEEGMKRGLQSQLDSLKNGERTLNLVAFAGARLPKEFIDKVAARLCEQGMWSEAENRLLMLLAPSNTAVSASITSTAPAAPMAQVKSPALAQIGPYRLLEEIGCGGMGRVFKAHHPQLDRVVAIKVMHARSGMAEKERNRFFAEAKITAKLKHPNIVAVHDMGNDENGQPYLVMDFIDGCSLAHQLSQGRLPARQALSMIRELALAMQYAHDNGIIHRDLKPANILLEKDSGRSIITDFGLAKNVRAADNLTQTGEIVGTPRYMAPEQISHRLGQISPLTDVYSLGAILYEMVTGSFAHAGDVPMNIMYNIIYQDIVPARKKNPALSRELELICSKMMEKQVEHRYQSAQAAAADIDRLLNGEMILAKRRSLPARVWQKVRQRKIAALTSLLLLLCLLVAWGFAYGRERQQQTQKLRGYRQEIGHLQQGFRQLEARLETTESDNGGEESIDRQQWRQQAVESQIAIASLWEKIGELPGSKAVGRELFEAHRRIGLLALGGHNYLLSRISFERCRKLGWPDEADKLLSLVEQKKVARQNAQLERTRAILREVGKALPDVGMIDEYVTEIVRMAGTHTTAELIRQLDAASEWTRRVAIQALGKLGDTTTQVDGKDAVLWLCQRLETIDVQNEAGEAEDLIWALGRLRDGRANATVSKARLRGGENGVLWNKTRLPFSWIPMPTGKRPADEPMAPVASETPEQKAISLNQSGFDKHCKGDFDGALADYNESLRLAPHYPEAYNRRGLTWQAKNRLDEAMADYLKSISINPRNAEAYVNLGNVRRLKRDSTGAIAAYTQAIHLQPELLAAYLNRGVVRKDGRDFAGAIADYTRALQLKPDMAEIYCNRSYAFYCQGDFERGLADSLRAIELNPRFAEAYINAGICYRQKKQFAEAISCYNQALQINPRHAVVYRNRATARFEKGDTQGAVDDFTQAIQLEPQVAHAYKYRGIVLREQKHHREAAADFARYLQLEPNCADSGELKEYIGQYGKR